MSAKPAPRRYDPSSGWTRSTEFVAHTGRHVGPGTELSIRGERGRFRFIEHVLTDAGVAWITVVGGPKGVRALRSFRPDRIRTVHTKKKTEHTPEEARRLVNEKNREKRSTRGTS